MRGKYPTKCENFPRHQGKGAKHTMNPCCAQTHAHTSKAVLCLKTSPPHSSPMLELGSTWDGAGTKKI